MTYVFSQWRKWSVDDWCVWGSCYGQWLMCLRFLLRSMTEVGHWRFAWGLACFGASSLSRTDHETRTSAPSPEALYKVFSQWREWSVTDEGLSSRGMVEAGSSSRTFLSCCSWTTQSFCKSWLCLLIIIWLNCWYLLLGQWRRCSVNDESDDEE